MEKNNYEVFTEMLLENQKEVIHEIDSLDKEKMLQSKEDRDFMNYPMEYSSYLNNLITTMEYKMSRLKIGKKGEA